MSEAGLDPRGYVMRRSYELGYSAFDILGNRRLAEYVQVRTLIAAELFGYGVALAAIGRAMNRHHTSVMYLLGMVTKGPEYKQPRRRLQ